MISTSFNNLNVRTSEFSSNNSNNLHLLLQQSLESQPQSTQQQQQVVNSQAQAAQRYKTELCRSFQENGTCKYGEKCQFAHGYQELRSMMRHPKYKSELCRTFHAQGYCPYGPRCHFVHEVKSDVQKLTETSRWVNTKTSTNNNGWNQYHSAPGSKSVSPKPDSGLLMCALSGSSSSLFSHDFNDWNSISCKTSSSSSSSTHEISPTSSRSLSPANSNDSLPKSNFYDDEVDFSTTMLVNQILNNINKEQEMISNNILLSLIN